METVSVSLLALVFTELLKKFIRWVLNKPDFVFSAEFYEIVIPVLNLALIPFAAILGVPGYQVPTDWEGYVKLVGVAAVQAIVQLVLYNMGIKPLKDYKKAQNVLP